MNKKRKAYIALLLSIIPGLGHLYAGKIRKVIIILAVFILNPLLKHFLYIEYTLPGYLIVRVGLILFYVYTIIDAAVSCRKSADYEIQSFNKWYYYILYSIVTPGLLTVVLLLNNNFLRTANLFHLFGNSMKPTAVANDRVLAIKNHFKSHKIERGEIVTFIHEGKDYISRCVALEGDRLRITGEKVYLNGKIQNEPYLLSYNQKLDPEKSYDFTYQIPEGSIFVMGDNRRNSLDSRYLGYIKMSDVTHKILMILYSSDCSKIGKYL